MIFLQHFKGSGLQFKSIENHEPEVFLPIDPRKKKKKKNESPRKQNKRKGQLTFPFSFLFFFFLFNFTREINKS